MDAVNVGQYVYCVFFFSMFSTRQFITLAEYETDFNTLSLDKVETRQ